MEILKNFLKAAAIVITLTVSSTLCADMKVTFTNDTSEYAFYFNSDYSTKVSPGESHTFTLKDHTTMVVGMDYMEHPTPWVKYGLGYGGVSYSIDPSSGQANFSFSLGPASASSIEEKPPAIMISGGVSMEGTDSWKKGISLQPHGTSAPTTVKFTDQ
ncbi:MAG: hypothetical protein H7A41_07560 [Chlamydiales bacterium]|nr:hypothetical protein [Chlamydiales bacterium]